jgi:hypothetical protein
MHVRSCSGTSLSLRLSINKAPQRRHYESQCLQAENANSQPSRSQALLTELISHYLDPSQPKLRHGIQYFKEEGVKEGLPHEGSFSIFGDIEGSRDDA